MPMMEHSGESSRQGLHGFVHFLPGEKVRFIEQDERCGAAAADERKVALHAPGVEVRSRLRHHGYGVHIGSQNLFRAAFSRSFAGKTRSGGGEWRV